MNSTKEQQRGFDSFALVDDDEDDVHPTETSLEGNQKSMLVRVNTRKMESYLQNIKKQLVDHDARLREQASSTNEHHRGEALLVRKLERKVDHCMVDINQLKDLLLSTDKHSAAHTQQQIRGNSNRSPQRSSVHFANEQSIRANGTSINPSVSPRGSSGIRRSVTQSTAVTSDATISYLQSEVENLRQLSRRLDLQQAEDMETFSKLKQLQTGFRILTKDLEELEKHPAYLRLEKQLQSQGEHANEHAMLLQEGKLDLQRLRDRIHRMEAGGKNIVEDRLSAIEDKVSIFGLLLEESTERFNKGLSDGTVTNISKASSSKSNKYELPTSAYSPRRDSAVSPGVLTPVPSGRQMSGLTTDGDGTALTSTPAAAEGEDALSAIQEHEDDEELSLLTDPPEEKQAAGARDNATGDAVITRRTKGRHTFTAVRSSSSDEDTTPAQLLQRARSTAQMLSEQNAGGGGILPRPEVPEKEAIVKSIEESKPEVNESQDTPVVPPLLAHVPRQASAKDILNDLPALLSSHRQRRRSSVSSFTPIVRRNNTEVTLDTGDGNTAGQGATIHVQKHGERRRSFTQSSFWMGMMQGYVHKDEFEEAQNDVALMVGQGFRSLARRMQNFAATRLVQYLADWRERLLPTVLLLRYWKHWAGDIHERQVQRLEKLRGKMILFVQKLEKMELRGTVRSAFNFWAYQTYVYHERERLHLYLCNIVKRWKNLKQYNLKEFLNRWKRFVVNSYRTSTFSADGYQDEISRMLESDDIDMTKLKTIALGDIKKRWAYRQRQERIEKQQQVAIESKIRELAAEGGFSGALTDEQAAQIEDSGQQVLTLRKDVRKIFNILDGTDADVKRRVEGETRKIQADLLSFKNMQQANMKAEREGIDAFKEEVMFKLAQQQQVIDVLTRRLVSSEEKNQQLINLIEPLQKQQIATEQVTAQLEKGLDDTAARIESAHSLIEQSVKSTADNIASNKHLEQVIATNGEYYNVELRDMRKHVAETVAGFQLMRKSNKAFGDAVTEHVIQNTNYLNNFVMLLPTAEQLFTMCLDYEELWIQLHSEGAALQNDRTEELHGQIADSALRIAHHVAAAASKLVIKRWTGAYTKMKKVPPMGHKPDSFPVPFNSRNSNNHGKPVMVTTAPQNQTIELDTGNNDQKDEGNNSAKRKYRFTFPTIEHSDPHEVLQTSEVVAAGNAMLPSPDLIEEVREELLQKYLSAYVNLLRAEDEKQCKRRGGTKPGLLRANARATFQQKLRRAVDVALTAYPLMTDPQLSAATALLTTNSTRAASQSRENVYQQRLQQRLMPPNDVETTSNRFEDVVDVCVACSQPIAANALQSKPVQHQRIVHHSLQQHHAPRRPVSASSAMSNTLHRNSSRATSSIAAGAPILSLREMLTPNTNARNMPIVEFDAPESVKKSTVNSPAFGGELHIDTSTGAGAKSTSTSPSRAVHLPSPKPERRRALSNSSNTSACDSTGANAPQTSTPDVYVRQSAMQLSVDSDASDIVLPIPEFPPILNIDSPFQQIVHASNEPTESKEAYAKLKVAHSADGIDQMCREGSDDNFVMNRAESDGALAFFDSTSESAKIPEHIRQAIMQSEQKLFDTAPLDSPRQNVGWVKSSTIDAAQHRQSLQAAKQKSMREIATKDSILQEMVGDKAYRALQRDAKLNCSTTNVSRVMSTAGVKHSTTTRADQNPPFLVTGNVTNNSMAGGGGPNGVRFAGGFSLPSEQQLAMNRGRSPSPPRASSPSVLNSAEIAAELANSFPSDASFPLRPEPISRTVFTDKNGTKANVEQSVESKDGKYTTDNEALNTLMMPVQSSRRLYAMKRCLFFAINTKQKKYTIPRYLKLRLDCHHLRFVSDGNTSPWGGEAEENKSNYERGNFRETYETVSVR